MSRYYRVDIDDGNGNFKTAYTSWTNGQNDPGALNVMLDIPVTSADQPSGSPYVRVWGISLKTISRATNLYRRSIRVYGGMQKGLPLANPAQAGLLTGGMIQRCWGNWIGTEMTVDIVFSSGGIPLPQNGVQPMPNLTMNCKAGTSLTDAIRTALQTAYPNDKININLSRNLVTAHDIVSWHGTFSEFADNIRTTSRNIVGGSTYPGISMSMRDNVITVWDVAGGDAKTINFYDMIGQPTWIAPFQIQATCVMRADLTVGQLIKMPDTPTVRTTAEAWPQFNNVSAQAGTFQVTSLRHVGNFRAPQGEAWITIINATQQTNG